MELQQESCENMMKDSAWMSFQMMMFKLQPIYAWELCCMDMDMDTPTWAQHYMRQKHSTNCENYIKK